MLDTSSLTHSWVGCMMAMELKTPEHSGSLPESIEAIFTPGFRPGYPALAGVRGYKAFRRSNNSACLCQVLSPRRQGGLKSHSADGNADIEGFSMTATSPNAMIPSVLRFEDTDVHIIDRDGRPWVSATDLARALGYSPR